VGNRRKEKALKRAYVWGTLIAGGELDEAREAPIKTEQGKVTIKASYLGGTTKNITEYAKGSLYLNSSKLFFTNDEEFFEAPHQKLLSIKITGKGQYSTGGGWIGGGIGFTGAMKGAAEATILNALTTRIHYDCLLTLVYEDFDLTFQVLDRTPQLLEANLSGIVKYLREKSPANPSKINPEERIHLIRELGELLSQGLITQSEFDAQKKEILK
jgi:hypothetical protein